MDHDLSYVGLGVYTIPEAARLLKTPGRTLYNWVRGYHARGRERTVAPMFTADHPELVAEHILTFVDLVEMHVVRSLRVHGVSLRTIRAAASILSQRFDTRHPFAVQGLRTDGKNVFLKGEGGTEELGPYQFVFEAVIEPFLKQLEYHDGVASLLWPIGKGRVALDPQRNFGKPIVHRGAVPTYPLYQMRKAGESPERIARWFGANVEAVNCAVEYEYGLAAWPIWPTGSSPNRRSPSRSCGSSVVGSATKRMRGALPEGNASRSGPMDRSSR